MLRLRHAGVVVEAQPQNVVPVAVTAGDEIEEPTAMGLRPVPLGGPGGRLLAAGGGQWSGEAGDAGAGVN
jgi:hypothetical protein